MSERQQTRGPEDAEPGKDSRRSYEPPRLTVVKINLEEVALAACKSVGGGGPGASCVLGCVVGGS